MRQVSSEEEVQRDIESARTELHTALHDFEARTKRRLTPAGWIAAHPVAVLGTGFLVGLWLGGRSQ